MPLTSGSRLGPYEIQSAIGAGGMGEVFRARDLKLNRDVAIKVLPDLFAADPDRLARFEREAQSLGALNHPNIAHVYGVIEDPPALVMELVEGEDLSQRIARGPIPLDEALTLATQIADALEAAHERGIIHRDLKPANIKIREDGTVKVLDFGLAKTVVQGFSPADGSSEGLHHETLMNSPTFASPAMTEMGMILGTAAYMAPEQAKGKPVDKRADIWAFGVVLFEMLTGRAAFSGDTATDVIAAVVTRDPDWTQLPLDTPAPIRRLLRRCVEKDPKRRLRDASDVRIEIEDAQRGTTGTEVDFEQAGARASSSRNRWIRGGLTMGALVAAFASGVFTTRQRTPVESSVRILNLTLPSSAAPVTTISPDGRWIAAVSDQKLVVKGADRLAWEELPGTAGAGFPLFWSPDSRWIGFPIAGGLKKADLVGSPPQTLCERCVQAGTLRGASWNGDGVILLAHSGDDARLAGGLFKISDRGGTLERVTSLDASRGENSHRFPTFLPDGRRFLFTVRRDNGEHEIRVGDLAGSPSRVLLSAFSNTAVTGRHLLFVRDETLLALAFDPATATVSGDPVKVAARVWQSPGVGYASFAAADGGTLIFMQAERQGYAFFDRHGQKLLDVTGTRGDGGARISPDGRRFVIGETNPEKGSADIYVIDVVTGARTRLTSDPNWEQRPVWSPDGRRVAYQARPNGRHGVNIQDATGGNERRLYEPGSGAGLRLYDWSPDGKYLLLWTTTATGAALSRVAVSDGRIEPWVSSRASLGEARFSPDGRWVAYVSAESGSPEVHVRSFPDGAVAQRVTTAGGAAPLWRHDGKELYYRDRDGWVVATGVRPLGASLEMGKPQRLFRMNVTAGFDMAYQHDIDASGRFFRPLDEIGTARDAVTVMLNWASAVTR